MATLGSYAKRQSQTASAADSTMQALMMLMQHQQQSEDRRLSREQMGLQSEQLRGLLQAQQREERESQPGVATVRTLEQVFTQGDYAALEEVLKSSELYMQNPGVVFGETAVTDVPSAFVRGLGEEPSTQDYATLSAELTNRYERLKSFVGRTAIPKEEQDDFLNRMKDRINALVETPEGVKFKQGIISKTIQSGLSEGSMSIKDTDSPDFMRGVLKANPLFGDQDYSDTLPFLTDVAKKAIQQSRTPTIQALQNTVAGIEDEDMQEAATDFLKDPSSLNEILSASDPRRALFNMVENMPEAEPGFFSKTGELLSDAGGVVADNPGTTFLTGYGGYKALEKLRPLWPLLKPFAAPLAKVLGGAEVVGRTGQEQGLLPGEGVFLGEDSMLQGSMSKISRAKELQQGLPEDQRVGGFGGVLRGIGDEIYDLFSSNQKEATYVPIPRQLDGNTMGPEQLGPPPPPPLYGPENQPLYGPETQPPLQGPLTQDQAQLQALASKIENAVAQDQAQQQALIEAGIFPMAGVSPDDNLLQGPSTQMNAEIDEAFKFNELLEAYLAQPLQGPETQPPLQGPETQPPLYGPETQPPLQEPLTQDQALMNEFYGTKGNETEYYPQASLQESQMGAEEYLRALSIRQAQQQEMQQALLGLMQQPF